jgi:hypothetical protein
LDDTSPIQLRCMSGFEDVNVVGIAVWLDMDEDCPRRFGFVVDDDCINSWIWLLTLGCDGRLLMTSSPTSFARDAPFLPCIEPIFSGNFGALSLHVAWVILLVHRCRLAIAQVTSPTLQHVQLALPVHIQSFLKSNFVDVCSVE